MDDFENWLKDTVSAPEQNPSKFRYSPPNQDKGPIQSYNTNQRQRIENGNGQPSNLDQITNNLSQSNPSGFQHLNGTAFHPDPTSFNPHSHLSVPSTFNSRPLTPPPVSDPSTTSRQQKRTRSSFQFDNLNKDAERQKDYENTSHFFGVENKQRQNQYDNESSSDLRTDLLQIISKLKAEFDTEKTMRESIQREVVNIKHESDTYIKFALTFSEKCAEFLATFPRQMKEARDAYDDRVRILDRKIAEVEILKQKVQTQII
ncbi:hypothetical protein BTUL_0306g00060 [Botrytis tulipae]|uniref:Uncharacterized protein n=1 Tax=Botrytis tulipae TaxID=87230 RepID=A0A4Z1E9E3_9HELO|nr:hypothetical protein BTUL_0306g00060 [Botrytis tulipae]